MKGNEPIVSLGSAMAELVSGKAHRVHPADVTRQLGERFFGQSILLAMLAREKAATVRISFDGSGKAEIGETRQVGGRGQGELARVLQAEARSIGARWGLIVFALGWQAVIGARSSRPGPDGTSFDRFRLPLEQPELFCAHPQAEVLHACVDHPILDRSIVFSLRRRDVEEVLQDFRTAQLGVAGVRIGVAAQLEAWMASGSTEKLESDLLISDSLSALLLQVEGGEFRAPAPSHAGMDGRPRQAAARPGETAADVVRFLRDQARGRVRVIGALDLAATAKAGIAGTDIDLLRAEEGPWHDSVSAVLATGVFHDLNPDVREERPPLSPAWRNYILAGLAASIILIVAGIINVWQVCRAGWQCQAAEEQLAFQKDRRLRAEAALQGIQDERQRAHRLRQWIAHNYHAQPLAHEILRRVPPGIGLERLAAHLEEGNAQMTLEFTLLGDESAQVAATRALERAVIDRSLQIGERHPATAASRGFLYRWRLLLPGTDWEDGSGQVTHSARHSGDSLSRAAKPVTARSNP